MSFIAEKIDFAARRGPAKSALPFPETLRIRDTFKGNTKPRL